MNGHSSDSPTYVILIVSECQKFFYTVQCTAIYSWSTPPPPRCTPPPHSAPPCSTPRSTPPAPPSHCSSPTTLLPHTTPPLHHTSPSPCVRLFRSETASTLLCWCNRTSKSEGSGSLTTAGSTWGLVGRVLQDLEQANGLGLCGSRNPRQLAAKRPAGGSWV